MIDLYINGQRVDLSGETFAFTYQTEDLSNPTAVKNSFSSTITLQGTPNNNRVFGNIWQLDRIQGANAYNPTQRADFALYKDGNLVESGYVQLSGIKRDKTGDYTYSVNLFGGLGDFFYSLKYAEDGETQTLASLVYPCEDELQEITINKNLVAESFAKTQYGESSALLDTLAFIPSYNGKPDDFDGDKVLVRLADSTNVLPTQRGDFKPVNGFGLVSLPETLTEWEVRDLRSYKQRPALKFSQFLRAVCNPANNGGYSVNLDTKFFNERNPYYRDSFLALPLLGSLMKGDDIKDTADLDKYNPQSIAGDTLETSENLVGTSEHISTTAGHITLQNVPTLTKVETSVIFSLVANVESDANRLYSCYYEPRYPEADIYHYGGIIAQAVVKDGTGKVVGYSDALQLIAGKGNTVLLWSNPHKAKRVFIHGSFSRIGTNRFAFVSSEGGNSFALKCAFTRTASADYTVTLNLYRASDWLTPRTSDLFTATSQAVAAETTATLADCQLSISWRSSAMSNTTIRKTDLLKTEKTPADILLDYCKMFGLMFVKDKYTKRIDICTRSTFYNGETRNLAELVDYSQDISITPLTFANKFYRLKNDGIGDKYAEQYAKDYGTPYGSKKVDTNYNFDSSIKDLITSSLQNLVTIRDVSPYYRTFRNINGVSVPPFLLGGGSLALYNTAGESEEEELSPRAYINTAVNWYARSGQDNKLGICCYSEDKGLKDLTLSLVLFNGVNELKDEEGSPVTYCISDDLAEMSTLNEGKPCYVYAMEGTETIRTSSLPQFTRYAIEDGDIKHALDFGQPRELYADGISYSESAPLYEGFLAAFLGDQADENTRKVSAYIRMTGTVDASLLGSFYYFEGCLWILNKISNYDITKDKPVLCEFIRVQDNNNYTNGVKTF